MDTPITFDTEQLLAQVPWIRRLAARVAGDAHLAEDLAQDALIVALGERRPDGAGSTSEPAALRRWLAAVVQNLGRTRRRSERRRAAREAAVAAEGLSPSAYEVVERFALQSELVQALLDLEEPYRSTLLLRYFDALSQREIAARTGVPVSTVGTRVAEGIRRLREKLRRRRSWMAALWVVPVGRSMSNGSMVRGGVLAMSLRAKVALVGIALLGAFGVYRCIEPTVTPPQTPGRVSAPPVEAVTDEPDPSPGRVAVVAEAAKEPTPGFADIPAHAGLRFGRVRGRVVDVAGLPVAGVVVGCLRPSLRPTSGERATADGVLRTARSDATGRFELEGGLPMELTAHDGSFATILGGVAREVDGEDVGEEEVVVVVGRRIPLGGVVVDAAGAPVEGVAITVAASVSIPDQDLRSSVPVVPRATSDPLGGFTVADAFAIEGAQIQFRAPGFATEVRPVPLDGDPAMHVVMSRDTASPYTITGRVRFADGSPAPGAYVSTGVMASRSDAVGRFLIDIEPWLVRVDEEAPTLVTAILPGWRPAERRLPSLREARTAGWPTDLVLELVDRPLTIGGVVVDEEGRPVAGLLVEPADMSDFGLVPMEGRYAFGGVPTSRELLIGRGPGRTDAEGRFEVTGLLDRDYTLRVLDRQSLLEVTTESVEAGRQGLHVVFHRGALGAIAGRVVDRHGTPIPGVRIAVSCKRVDELVIGRSTTSDADGSFRLEAVTTQPAFLRLEGESIVPELFRELGPDDDLTALRLQVGRRCRVQFDWGEWSGTGDELRVVDRAGEPLTMMHVTAGSIGERDMLGAQQGVSEVVLVSDAAAQAVVTRAGEEVLRLDLDLRVDGVNRIRL